MDKSSKSNLMIIVAIIIAAIVIFFAISYTGGVSSNSDDGNVNVKETANNVSVVDGKQIIEIKAKGGYSPEHSFAKAGVPTILRLNTNGTFDCTSIVRIPSMNINQNLPMTGITDINLGVQGVSTLQGTCGTGTYPFDIKFE